MSLVIPVDAEIYLRFIVPSHAEEIAAVVVRNRQHLARWLPWATDDYDKSIAREWIERVHNEFGQRRQLALSIMAGDQLVGGIGWTNWQMNRMPAWELTTASADIGYWLAADAQGRGIVTRATRALTEQAFGPFQMNRITIRAEPENQRSWSVPERLGFQYEGTHRHVCRWKDRWVDHKVYAMLAEDWA